MFKDWGILKKRVQIDSMWIQTINNYKITITTKRKKYKSLIKKVKNN